MAKELRLPPQDIDAEKALLGSIMLKPEAMHEIVDLVRPEAFYSEKHRIIYTNMNELLEKNEPIDILSLSSKLKEKKQLDSVGGGSYLSELVNFVPSAANIKHYADIVQKKAMMRNLIGAADHISELGYEESNDIEYVLDSAQSKILEVTNSPTLQKFVEIKDTLAEAWERLEHLHRSKDEIRGVRSGFRALDDLLAGFQKSDLVILAARPSMGKTSLALDIARQAAVHHKVPVGIFSLEMSSQQLVDRMLAAESHVNAWKLRTGKLSTDEEFDKIQEALGTLSQAPIYIDDKSSSNVLQMRAIARRLKHEKGLGLVIIDYLQLIMPTNSRNSDSMVQQVTEISRALKGMARELDVPVIALSQLSRAVEQRRGKPRLSDLRDSGSIEQDADVVMFIHRDDRMNENSDRPNIAEILVEKHRNGPVGSVELYFDDRRSTFLSIDKSDFHGAESSTNTDDF
ncbi:MAG: replicative DNA helicase [Candidatus Pacebacteria bacterium]|nr:replicative DNA helicase [Candidatus Paceibacterota bacterium]